MVSALRYLFCVLLPAFVLLVSVGCTSFRNESRVGLIKEAVLCDNTVISSRNKNGSFQFEYVKPLVRRLAAFGEVYEIKYAARTNRFRGRLGIYTNNGNFMSKGKIVSTEAVVNFRDFDELTYWLRQGNDVMDWVIDDGGLMVGLGVNRAAGNLNFHLYQVLIQGKKPDLSDFKLTKDISVKGQTFPHCWDDDPQQIPYLSVKNGRLNISESDTENGTPSQ